MAPHWKQPSHGDVLEVVSQPGSFASYSQAKTSFPPGALLARLAAPTLTLSQRAYSSVQVGPTDDIELNCDFLYVNHSCEPNVEFHILNSEKLLSKDVDATESDHPIVIEIRATARKDPQGNGKIGLQKGEQLTFFYPSTEWDMAQGFDCLCKTKSCKGLIRGAKYLSKDELDTYFINDHIRKLKEEQELAESSGNPSSGVTTSNGSNSDRDA